MRQVVVLLSLMAAVAWCALGCASTEAPDPDADGGECGDIGDRCETDADCCEEAGYRVSCDGWVCVERID